MKLSRFKGGIKLPGFKRLSNGSAVKTLPLPDKIILPLRQHIGEPAEPIVAVGDVVKKGQMVAKAKSFISASVHASTSGSVIAIERHPIPHPSGLTELCIIIEPDGLDAWEDGLQLLDDPHSISSSELLARIRDAGIVGLGGALFPSAAKLKPTRQIDTLLINGVECEPYITCDDLLMRTRAREIIEGILLLHRIVQPLASVIAVEDNKPEASAELRKAIEALKAEGLGLVNTIQVIEVPTRFPAGGEKQLIKVVTGKEVPQGGLPYEVGVVSLNVGTTAAIYDAIYQGRPLISRLVTLTGSKVKQAANYSVLLGTPVEYLIEAAGGTKSDHYQLVMGGPMMGQKLPSANVPITKAANCILIDETLEQAPTSGMPCIRCGTCASVCPMQLLPQQLYWHARGKAFEKLEHYHLGDCIECGCCAVVCPSQIPLVDYFRFAKGEQRQHQAKQQFAEQSRLRSQARDARLERKRQEQEERKARRKAARKKSLKPPAPPATETMENSESDPASAENSKVSAS